jgi:D-alanyl-D-alanine carboxypeptidase/D-alanyl-D-alanine-endopeptidase (penicillin-binding protein 4)
MLREAHLQNWAQKLRERGLKTVTGRIRGDGTLFHGTIYNDFWNWGDVGNGYGSGVSGLNLEHNRFLASFDAGPSVGAPATLLHTSPALSSWIIHNEVLTAETGTGDGVVIHGGEGAAPLHMRGTVPLGAKSFSVMGAAPDPVRMAEDRFSTLLRAHGRVQIEERTTETAGESHSLLTHESPRLADIVTSIHATSDNHETECVFRMLGVKAGKPPAEVIRTHWKARGLDFTALRMVDGCGLARANVISPHDLARLQFTAGIGPQGKEYTASLLSENGLRWKGGAMSGVRTFTGFATGKTGVSYSFAFMVNHTLNHEAVSALRQQLVEAMLSL